MERRKWLYKCKLTSPFMIWTNHLAHQPFPHSRKQDSHQPSSSTLHKPFQLPNKQLTSIHNAVRNPYSSRLSPGSDFSRGPKRRRMRPRQLQQSILLHHWRRGKFRQPQTMVLQRELMKEISQQSYYCATGTCEGRSGSEYPCSGGDGTYECPAE